MESVAIVGAGLGGAMTAKQLRAAGFTGTITVVGAERENPYDRPPLSKEILLGTLEHPKLPVKWDELEVEHRAGTAARGLTPDGDAWVVETGDGAVRADRVVVATGARPVCPAVLSGHPRARTLRTLDDARGLGAILGPDTAVLVVGAGWIGAEVASSAASMGCAVTVVEAETTPAAGPLGTEVGQWFAPWYAEAGVTTRFGRMVTGATPSGVKLDDGTELTADVVVVGVGVVPDTAWLSGGPVALDERGGALVDEHLRTSAAGVYAIGDCASYPSARYGGRLRPEHWTNAQQAAGAVAKTLVGEASPYDPVPYFWSKQFGRMVQYVGHHDPNDEVLFRGDPRAAKWSACWIRDGRPVALLAVNRPKDMAGARAKFAEEIGFDLAKLADENVPIPECVRD